MGLQAKHMGLQAETQRVAGWAHGCGTTAYHGSLEVVEYYYGP